MSLPTRRSLADVDRADVAARLAIVKGIRKNRSKSRILADRARLLVLPFGHA